MSLLNVFVTDFEKQYYPTIPQVTFDAWQEFEVGQFLKKALKHLISTAGHGQPKPVAPSSRNEA